MALRNILTEENPALRKVCRPYTAFDERLHQLLDDMHETLDKAEGVGLAAPQVGYCRRFFIMHLGDMRIEAINPEIKKVSGKQYVLEGCLSVPNKWGYVTRPNKCKFLCRNCKGKCVCRQKGRIKLHGYS